MDFTREPIIESVITPREGCKLVVRSSKGSGQEEYFVDAVEVVSFGNTFFFRSLERPKSFLVPSTDYEVLEVRETRMVLKNVGLDRTIKIGGGKERGKKGKEAAPAAAEKAAAEGKLEKKRDRRRHTRRRRGREEKQQKQPEEEAVAAEKPVIPIPPPEKLVRNKKGKRGESEEVENNGVSAVIAPPSTLISETIARYKDDQLFKDVFFPKEGELAPQMEVEVPVESTNEEVSE